MYIRGLHLPTLCPCVGGAVPKVMQEYLSLNIFSHGFGIVFIELTSLEIQRRSILCKVFFFFVTPHLYCTVHFFIVLCCCCRILG